jgi:flagellin-like hook-associated protein FlgL
MYLGTGASTEQIGVIDSFYDGSAGKSLRINYSKTFRNSNFEGSVGATSVDGWTILNQRIKLDGTNIVGGFSTPTDPTSATIGGGYETPSFSSGSFTTQLSAVTPSGSGTSIKMESNLGGVANTPNGIGGVLHGPSIISDTSVSFNVGDSVSFKWQAVGGADAYDVFAYLLNIDSGQTEIMLNQTGANASISTGWVTATHNIAVAGKYRFVFVSGSWDATAGQAAGARLFVDDLAINSSVPLSFSNQELSLIKNKVSYTSTATSDNASISINGVSVTSAAAPRNATSIAANLETAINTKINSGEIKNISVQRNAGVLTIQSTVAGTPFNLSGASTNYVDNLINISQLTSNSLGQTLVKGINNATAKSSEALTVYGTVQLVAQAPVLPDLPGPNEALETQMHRLFSSNEKPFTVSSGADGFGSNSNFFSLGFMEGGFGGRASSDMDPPKVGRLAFQVGSGTGQLVAIDLADFGKDGPITSEITGDVDQNLDQRKSRINTREGASDMLIKLDLSMDRVNGIRANMGAVMNRLDHIINNVTNVSMNMTKSRSVIEDADYATASSELAKAQIMQQAATAVLAQANTNQQTVLKLLGK